MCAVLVLQGYWLEAKLSANSLPSFYNNYIWISMPFPITISAGQYYFTLHSIFEFLAFFVAFRYFIFLRKKQQDLIESENRTWIIIGAIFGAIIGSRLIGGLENFPEMVSAPNKLLYFYQNKTVLGGFLGGLCGVELIKKIIKEKNSSGDLFTYPMILGLIIGRVGCFSMGVYEETYGIVTGFFTGMNLGDGTLRHPVTLYEILFLILLWISIVQVEKHRILPPGMRFKIFMMAYISFRFLIDFIKPHYTWQVGLSTIQVTCLAGVGYYAALYFSKKKLYLRK